MDNTSVIFVETMIDVQHLEATSCNENGTEIIPHASDSNQDKLQNDETGKHSAVWTSNATSTLLKLYESKLEMLETPKRKKRIWLAVSECLKEHNIVMSPDQVRWKINALTKKYKRCVDIGTHNKFKYFKEMDHIYSKYNIDAYGCTITDILDRKNESHRNIPTAATSTKSESKALIELRKIRLANRIESDRLQTKIHIEKQWLDYLHQQEQIRMQKDEVTDRSLQLKEQELELRKRELEFRQSLELKNLQFIENDINETVQVEREKCELLKQIFC